MGRALTGVGAVELAKRGVDQHVGLCTYRGNHLAIVGRIVRFTSVRGTGMEVDDRRAGRCTVENVGDDFVGRIGDVGVGRPPRDLVDPRLDDHLVHASLPVCRLVRRWIGQRIVRPSPKISDPSTLLTGPSTPRMPMASRASAGLR